MPRNYSRSEEKINGFILFFSHLIVTLGLMPRNYSRSEEKINGFILFFSHLIVILQSK